MKSSWIVLSSAAIVLVSGGVALAAVHNAYYYAGGDIPVAGDWNGDGQRKIGIYRHGLWILDWDGDRRFTSADRIFSLGGEPEDVPIVADGAAAPTAPTLAYTNVEPGKSTCAAIPPLCSFTNGAAPEIHR